MERSSLVARLCRASGVERNSDRQESKAIFNDSCQSELRSTPPAAGRRTARLDLASTALHVSKVKPIYDHKLHA